MPKKTTEQSDRDLGIRIGVAVRRYRELAGLTQRVLAERAHVAQPEISHIEQGKRSKLATLDRVSQALGKRLSDLVRFAEDIGDTESVKAEGRAFIKEVKSKNRRAPRTTAAVASSRR